ncbi:Uncharacterised protein [Candidatus Bilamarchaeum dharawalense]|uniref:Uncharacterized protein n=1 Tax=Candidatus Bilamarchaeum dharawalense TaxID=2885759 RepID=A0A5E4LYI2_9ARCH|nr:Uncharacterised protein [Candidatus Bilamarchaeum dharawalense]
MKYAAIVLAFIFFASLIFPVSTNCPDCAAFNDALPGRIFTQSHSADKTLEISAFYDNTSNSLDPRPPLNKTVILIELTNASNTAPYPRLYKVVTDDSGTAIFDFSTWGTDGCFNMKILYCPFCTSGSTDCGFAECLKFADMHNESGYYENIIGGGAVVNADDIEAAPGVTLPPGPYNNGTFLPELALTTYCAPPVKGATTPAFCLPLVIIFALLGGALYLSGQNPFGIFNLGSPRIGRHIRYQARARGFSFSLMSVIQAAYSIAGTAKAVSDAKAEAKEAAAKGEGKELTTSQAISKVETQRANSNVFIGSTIGFSSVQMVGGRAVEMGPKGMRGGISDFKKATDAAGAVKGGNFQELRGGMLEQMRGSGASVVMVGKELRTTGGAGGIGSRLDEKKGGMLVFALVNVLGSLPIFSILRTYGVDMSSFTNKSPTAIIAQGAAVKAAMTDAEGRAKIPIAGGGEAAVTGVRTNADGSTTTGLAPAAPKPDEKAAAPKPGETAPAVPAPQQGVAVTTTAPGAPVAGLDYSSGNQQVQLKAGDQGEAKVHTDQPIQMQVKVEGDAAKQVAALAAAAKPPDGVAVTTASSGEKQITVASGPNAGSYTVGADGAVTKTVPVPGGGQDYTVKDGVVTKPVAQPVAGADADAVRALLSPTTGQLPDGKVSVETSPSGEKQFKVEGGPQVGTYTVGADGSVNKIVQQPVTGDEAKAVLAAAAPGLEGKLFGGFALGGPSTMPDGTSLQDSVDRSLRTVQYANEQIRTGIVDRVKELGDSIPTETRLATATREAEQALAVSYGQPAATVVAGMTTSQDPKTFMVKVGDAVEDFTIRRPGFADSLPGVPVTEARVVETVIRSTSPADLEKMDEPKFRTAVTDAYTHDPATAQAAYPKYMVAVGEYQAAMAARVKDPTLPEPKLPDFQVIVGQVAAERAQAIDFRQVTPAIVAGAVDMRTELVQHVGKRDADIILALPADRFNWVTDSAYSVHNASQHGGDVSADPLRPLTPSGQVSLQDPRMELLIKGPIPEKLIPAAGEYAALQAAGHAIDSEGARPTNYDNAGRVIDGPSYRPANTPESPRVYQEGQDCTRFAVQAAAVQEFQAQQARLKEHLPPEFQDIMATYTKGVALAADGYVHEYQLSRAPAPMAGTVFDPLNPPSSATFQPLIGPRSDPPRLERAADALYDNERRVQEDIRAHPEKAVDTIAQQARFYGETGQPEYAEVYTKALFAAKSGDMTKAEEIIGQLDVQLPKVPRVEGQPAKTEDLLRQPQFQENTAYGLYGVDQEKGTGLTVLRVTDDKVRAMLKKAQEEHEEEERRRH